jgi:hypothetical protein
MFDNLMSHFKWNLITIDDPAFLSGKSICEIMQLLLQTTKFKFVILNDIEGSGKDWLISTLQKTKNAIVSMEDFLKILYDIKQFDWGDFFLFKEYPQNWKNTNEEIYYPNLINQTDTTIRAVDNQYIYIYTPDKEIFNVIKENYRIESIKTDFLENLDYPY